MLKGYTGVRREGCIISQVGCREGDSEGVHDPRVQRYRGKQTSQLSLF